MAGANTYPWIFTFRAHEGGRELVNLLIPLCRVKSILIYKGSLLFICYLIRFSDQLMKNSRHLWVHKERLWTSSAAGEKRGGGRLG